MKKINKTRGRPKISALSREAQLREAKRTQRAREKTAGITSVEIRLNFQQAALLKAARMTPDFAPAFDDFLNQIVVDITAWPALHELAWNRETPYIPAREALALYERNWRHVDESRLTPAEAALIERLKNQYGGGVLNA